MKNSMTIATLLLFITLMGTSCELVGDIFKAGFWSAFIVIGFVVILLIYIVTRLGRRGK